LPARRQLDPSLEGARRQDRRRNDGFEAEYARQAEGIGTYLFSFVGGLKHCAGFQRSEVGVKYGRRIAEGKANA